MNDFDMVFIRHGYSEGNLNNTLTGWTDVALAPQGITELENLKKTVTYPKTDLYFSSDLKRCLNTFDILFGHARTLNKTLPGFREINFGKHENADSSRIDFKRFFERWVNDEIIDDTEQFSGFTARILRELQNLCGELSILNKKSATVVCHSGVIKVIYIYFSRLHQSSFNRLIVPNGKGIHIKFSLSKGTDKEMLPQNINAVWL